MKKITIFVALYCLVLSAFAQSNGCDGNRYLNDVFTSVKKTTVQYATATTQNGGTMTLSVDIYEPQGDIAAARPLVLLAHGGSFIAGDKSMMQPYAELLAKKGYVVGSIQYRLWPFLFLGIPDSFKIMDTAVRAMGDMKAAARFFRDDAANANIYKIDPANVFFGGYSAGAVTALHSAYIDANDELPAFLDSLVVNNGGLNGNSGSIAAQVQPSDCRAVLNMSGGMYRHEWLDAGEVPLTSIHGTADETVNYNSGLAANIAYLEGSNLVHQQALTVGIPSHLETVQGAGHTNLYSNAQYAGQFAAFWGKATVMMEEIICASSAASDIQNARLDWEIIPNPTNGAFRLKGNPSQGNVNLRVFNSIGQEVRSLVNVNPANQIDLSALGKGVFTLQIFDAESKVYSVKQVIIH